jgi:hypothetical protein
MLTTVSSGFKERRVTGVGIDHSSRLAFRASSSSSFHPCQIGVSHYRGNTEANSCRINSSLTRVSPTRTKATVRPRRSVLADSTSTTREKMRM